MKKNPVIKFPNYKKPTNPINFFNGYNSALNKTIQEIDYKKVEKIYKILNSTIKKKGQIFVAGNGGAASISNHFLCDFNKGIKSSSNKVLMPKIISLSNSIETITAISNDINYESIFSFQLENYVKKYLKLFVK